MNNRQIMQNVLQAEAQALTLAGERLDDQVVEDLSEIFTYLHSVGGPLIFCGVGKSGHVAKKLASTFVSLGLPSYFLHPTEALHGDIGLIQKNAAVVFLSKSGTTEEILKLFPFLEINQNLVIGLLGNTQSPIAERCGVVLDCQIEREACLNNLAPTTSSTLAMAMGDAMAVLYEKIAGLSREGFASNHPGGLLGKALRLKVKDIMIPWQDCPIVKVEDQLKDVIVQMTDKSIGLCAVCDENRRLLGIMVEGDIRRAFAQPGNDLFTPIQKLMTEKPVVVSPDDMAMTTLQLMEKRSKQLSQVPVVEDQKFVGAVRIHDLLKAGFPSQK